jgi:hypothetical protein
MRKIILVLSFIQLCFLQSRAQGWSPVGSGISFPVNSMTNYNGNLIAGADGVYKWNGSTWSGMNTGLQSFGGGAVYGLAVSNSGNLYCGGANFFVNTPSSNLYNYIARWGTNTWTVVGSGTGNDGSGMWDVVSVLTSYNGNLYAGGDFTEAGGDPTTPYSASHIASFAGTSCCWAAVGAGVNNNVRELLVDTVNNFLYVGGYFTSPGNYIAKWNGSSWSALGSGTNGKITALCIHNGEVYAGGVFTAAGGNPANNIAKWNGSSWSPLGAGLDSQVNDLVSYNGELYAGGQGFTVGSNTHYIVKWNGTSWSALGLGVDNAVYKMFVFNNELYVGGNFTNAGGNSANHIAKYVAISGIHENSITHSLIVSPNPNTGKFSIEGTGELSIYNLMGQKIHTQSLYGQRNEISLDQQKGVYFVELRSQDRVSKAKLVIGE